MNDSQTLQDLFNRQKSAFQDGGTRDPSVRIAHLKTLRRILSDNEDAFADALWEDFRKPRFETYVTEIGIVLKDIDFHIRNLRRWAAPQRVPSFLGNLPSREFTLADPFGVVLILGAWNYPVNLTIQPLVGALSAGNTVFLKPSEFASSVSGLLTRLLGEAFPKEMLTVVEGDGAVASQLVSMPFDKIFFTGSTHIGRQVMKAAAENLTPVTLELGGKSPTIVDRTADLEVAARRIWWGKWVNGGQTCVAPDFVLVDRAIMDRFVDVSRTVLREFRGEQEGEPHDRQPADFASIINQRHFDRIRSLYDPSEALIGGGSDPQTRTIQPTLIKATPEHPSMQEEIFGPLLPMIPYDTQEEAIAFLKQHPAPLALYIFSKDRRFTREILDQIPFGGGCINDTISQLANVHLPFGGIGPSGMGAYHGKASFDAFSRRKAIVHRTTWPDIRLRYPPYSGKLAWIKRLLRFA